MNSGFARRLLTVGLVAALPLLAAAQPLTSVAGTVFAGTDGTPLVGARVHLMQTGTKTIYTSTVTTADGAFDVSDLPAGSYDAAVEFDGGLYVVENPVVVTAGRQGALNLAIPLVAKNPTQHTNVRGAGAFFSSPLSATLLVAGSAITVGALIDAQANDNGASPY